MKKLALAGALALAFATPATAQEADTSQSIYQTQASSPPASAARSHIRQARLSAPFEIRTPAQLASVAMRYVGARRFTPYARAWCRDAVNVWLRQAGYWTDGDGRARAVASLGPRVAPAPGVIAFRAHHTGVVAKVEAGRVLLVHGNSHGRVRLTWFSARSFQFVQPVRG